jgi:hypothetical protein
MAAKKIPTWALVLIIVGAIGGVVIALGMVIAVTVAVPNLVRARDRAREVSAIASLRSITMAQELYAAACGGSFYSPSLENLGTPATGTAEAFLSPDLGKAGEVVKNGYVVRMRGTIAPAAPPTCNGLPAGRATVSYVAVAEPVDGKGACFAANTNAVIYQHTSSLDRAMPETGSPNVGRPVY